MIARHTTDAMPLVRLRGEMGRLFELFFGDFERSRAWDPVGHRRFPAVNVWQEDDSVLVEAELPGLAEDEIALTVAGSELTIKGERTHLESTKGTAVQRRERGSGEFSRVVHLPVDVNEEKIDAAFCNGVLTITLAKADAAKSRRISVKAISA